MGTPDRRQPVTARMNATTKGVIIAEYTRR
jgi:hypothetical protein